jgi:AcrR family transcriptional regulator
MKDGNKPFVIGDDAGAGDDSSVGADPPAVGPPAVGPPAVGRRERRKAETKQRIVDAATVLFWSKGYDATSVLEITEAADVAPATFYLHFESKADVALTQFHEWVEDFLSAVGSRPEGETPEQMLAATLQVLDVEGYATGRQLRDSSSRPVAPIVMGMLFAETSPEVAGRVHQAITRTEQALTDLFRQRLGYRPESMEPRIIAAAFVASLRVAVYGFADLINAGLEPPAPNEIGLQSFSAYARGIEDLWASGPTTDTRS